MSRAPRLDSLDLAALQLGRRNADLAEAHVRLALQHLEAATMAITPIIGLGEERQEAKILTAALVRFQRLLDKRFGELHRCRQGPKLTDLAVAEEAVQRPMRGEGLTRRTLGTTEPTR